MHCGGAFNAIHGSTTAARCISPRVQPAVTSPQQRSRRAHWEGLSLFATSPIRPLCCPRDTNLSARATHTQHLGTIAKSSSRVYRHSGPRFHIAACNIASALSMRCYSQLTMPFGNQWPISWFQHDEHWASDGSRKSGCLPVPLPSVLAAPSAMIGCANHRFPACE